MTLPNRHPADELADLRAELRRLEDREANLRDMLLAEGADLVGSEHVARIVASPQHRLDRELLEQRFGAAAVRACRKPVTVTMVRLEPLGPTSQRKKAAAPTPSPSLPQP